MTYTRRQFTRIEYVLPTDATGVDLTIASTAIDREAGDHPVTFETSRDRTVLYFDLPDGA